jgi:phosphoglycerate kinase
MKFLNSYNFKNKKVLLRVDFNVPLDKETGEVADDKRIKAALPTINYILDQGGAVILLSHFGRPKEGKEDKYSLSQILPCLEKCIGKEVFFSPDCIGETATEKSNSLLPGQILLMENVRFYKEETLGDLNFAQELAKLGDCFVNDAFGAAHRAHTSTTQIASFFPNDKMMGFLMQGEIDNANKIMQSTVHPFTAIVGGAKVSDKILIVENLLLKADNIIIGGGMAYTFFKAMGGEIGNSLCEEDRLETCLSILSQAKEKGVSIYLPIDSIIADQFSATANIKNSPSDAIPENWMALDIGARACLDFETVLLNSKTILWNGPMGVFEMEAFEIGTKSVAYAVATATKSGAFSLIGGGDSAAAIMKFGLEDEVSYVSTGGGALLEYFEGKQLPGLLALEN